MEAANLSLNAKGADMVRDIERSLEKQNQREQRYQKKRDSLSRSLPEKDFIEFKDVGKASDIAQPGGFRRQHVKVKHEEEGIPLPDHVHTPFLRHVQHSSNFFKNVRNLYDEFFVAQFEVGQSQDDEWDDESLSPLVRRAARKRDKLASMDFIEEKDTVDFEDRGNNVTVTVITLFKAFFGPGLLFLPKAFEHGGFLMSAVSLFILGAICCYNMLLLTDSSNALSRGGGASLAKIGATAYGKVGRLTVNMSLILSQLGFCSANLVFVATNIRDLVQQLTHCHWNFPMWAIILCLIPLLTPLVWVRKIQYFAITNLLGDMLILIGILVLSHAGIREISSEAVSVSFWNPSHFLLFVGSAMYNFEGVGLILPIYAGLDESHKHKFPAIVGWTMLTLVGIFCVFGSLLAIAFGRKVHPVVTLNLPHNELKVTLSTFMVQVGYCVALLFCYPLQIYPPISIVENKLFDKHVEREPKLLQKNLLRFVLVSLTAAVSLVAIREIDVFVSLVGGFCCIPLALIYPPLFHKRLTVQTPRSAFIDKILIAFGSLLMLAVTLGSLWKWQPAREAFHQFCFNPLYLP